MLQVTTSWDDGDALDVKLAVLLQKYDIAGTFYVTRDYRKNSLSSEDIRNVATRHEVGAHSLTHPDLRTLTTEQKKDEIQGSKKWLEELLGKEVPMFCYPSGHFDAESERIAREAGFKGARTTKPGEIRLSGNSFQMPTTLGVYPMPFRKTGPHTFYWRELLQPLRERAPGLRSLGVPLRAFRSWEALACATFDIALKRGEVFHLWGHSWEIERYDMWESLKRVLRYIGNRDDCQYVTNGELIREV
ncbi:polysaccharide deacetylase family protein [Candidatus Kaiserbacteria bacterium]|nr:polysaccharide deacetylase family protein [Candidatus Kaiserbacteria bacterium]